MSTIDLDRIPAAYPELVLKSADRYREHLDLQVSHFSDAIRPGVRHLIELLSRLERPSTLQVGSLGFAADELRDANAHDVDLLINQWCLGWGRDDAPVISMGTEEAYPARPVDLGLWNCCCAVVWATAGRPDILAAIDSRSAHPDPPIDGFEARREFHLHANDYFLIHQRHWDPDRQLWVRPGRHTWKLLAEVIAGRGRSAPLLAQNVGSLGLRAYQIEVSAFPAKAAVEGRMATEDRHRFLSDLLGAMRSTAKVLIFHGRASEPGWGGRDSLVATFLRSPKPSPTDWTRESHGGQVLQHIEDSGRTVVLTRALNGSVSGALIDRGGR